MELKSTLETVSLSLSQAAQAVKKLESVAGPTEIVNSLNLLRGDLSKKLEGIEKVLLEIKKQQEHHQSSILGESEKQTELATKQARMMTISANQAIISGNISRNTNAGYNKPVLIYFTQSLKTDEQPPYTYSNLGLSSIPLESYKKLAAYYGIVDKSLEDELKLANNNDQKVRVYREKLLPFIGV